MTEKTQKRPTYKISVGSFYYALNTLTPDGLFNPEGFGEVVESPVIKNVSVSEETENIAIRASGQTYDSRSSSNSTDISVEVIAIDPEDLYTMRGEGITEKGLVFGGGTTERPFVAIGYPVYKNNKISRFVWYPKCKLIENTDDIATSEESYNEQNDTLTFTAMPFNNEGNTKVEIDTSTELGKDALEKDFFKQVILLPSDYVVGA